MEARPARVAHRIDRLEFRGDESGDEAVPAVANHTVPLDDVRAVREPPARPPERARIGVVVRVEDADDLPADAS